MSQFLANLLLIAPRKRIMKLIIFIFFVVLLEFCKIDYIIKFEINISLYLHQCSQHHILYTFLLQYPSFTVVSSKCPEVWPDRQYRPSVGGRVRTPPYPYCDSWLGLMAPEPSEPSEPSEPASVTRGDLGQETGTQRPEARWLRVQ